jgi:type II secretory pathway pseudopilin PulG
MRTRRQNSLNWQTRRTERGVTLVEVLVAFVISGLALAGMVSGYIFANTSAEKFALSLAANAQASQMMEQMRSATWDISSFPVIDELTASNFPNQVVTLELTGAGTNVIYATNFAQISTISSNPPLRRIHVDTVWNYRGIQVWTNSIETCRAPDQ